MSHLLVLASTSRAQDAGYVAMADVAAIARDVGATYRIVGGHMVSLLVTAHGVAGVPDRETADADLGTTFDVVANPALPAALKDRGYASAGAANRFERGEDAMTLAIDVLAPSYTGRLQTNQQHGDLVVDEIPGLGYALVRPAVDIDLDVRLTDGRELQTTVVVPDLISAICLKALAYGSRYARSDALDLWRLLETAHAAGIRAAEWPTGPTPAQAADVLQRFFYRPSATGLADISDEAAIKTRVRALVHAVVGPPAG
jgi:hypothetical protein